MGTVLKGKQKAGITLETYAEYFYEDDLEGLIGTAFILLKCHWIDVRE